jgi:hypothetical protein
MAASTGASASITVMSGRGTMTSRTTVSPKSMIERMSVRSSDSMTSALTATSARASSSSSETTGPAGRPLPGRMRLDSPISTHVRKRTGGKRASTETTGATSKAARAVCWRA